MFIHTSALKNNPALIVDFVYSLLIPEDENLTISFKPEKEGELSKEGQMLESTLFHVNLQLKEVRQCSIIGINSV